VKVKGVVQLDGVPVEGATVSFISEDGKDTYSGFTDASGNFSLSSGPQEGARPGTYKVTVVKAKKLEGDAITGGDGAAGGPGDAMLKEMERMHKEGAGKKQKIFTPMPGKMPPKGGPMAGPGSSTPASEKSELPGAYAHANSTPLKVTIPGPQPVVIDLKSKP